MKKHLIYLISLFIYMSLSVISWTQINFNPTTLKIGDKIPDVTLSPLINYYTAKINPSSFDEKELLILYFWSTACIPCVAKFPELDNLQRKFNDDIQLLLITPEEEKRIRPFYDRIVKSKNLILPTAIDATLSAYFNTNNSRLGSYVWLQRGTIIAFSEINALTEDNILLALAGKPINNIITKPKFGFSELKDFDKPFLMHLAFDNEGIISLAAFTKYMDSLKPTLYEKLPNASDNSAGLRYINCSLARMYLDAYSIPSNAFASFEVTDKLHFNPLPAEQDSTNLFCYELMAPGKTKIELLHILQEDLKRKFGYEVTIEKRTVQYLQLSTSKKLSPSQGAQPFASSSPFHLHLTNAPFSHFIFELKNLLLNANYIDLIDKSNINDLRIDLELNTDMTNPKHQNTQNEECLRRKLFFHSLQGIKCWKAYGKSLSELLCPFHKK